jgi:hypothetical protein
MVTRIMSVAAAVCLIAGACSSGDGTDQTAMAVRDSAGVRIVENTSPAESDGSFLDEQSLASIQPTAVGLAEYTRIPIRYDRDGANLDTIAMQPGTKTFRAGDGTYMMQWDLPFGRVAMTAVHDDALYFGNGAEFAIEQFRADGTHVASIRAPSRAIAVTDELHSQWVEDALAAEWIQRNPGGEAQWRKRYEDTPSAEMLPEYDKLLADAGGRIWARIYSLPWEPRNTWRVFDNDGAWQTDVELPAGLDPFEFGKDYVLGVRKDELDVEYIEMYRVE